MPKRYIIELVEPDGSTTHAITGTREDRFGNIFDVEGFYQDIHSTTFKIRNFPNLTTTWELRVEGETFKITSIIPDKMNQRRYSLLSCETK